MDLSIDFDQLTKKQKIVLLLSVTVIFFAIGFAFVIFRGAFLSPKASKTTPSSRVSVVTPVPTVSSKRTSASFSLTSPAGTVKVGQTFVVSLNLSSGDLAVEAVDAVLNYDPRVLKVVKVTPGKLFDRYPIAKFDNNKGKIQLSAIAGIKGRKVSRFTGKGELGTVTLRALKPAKSTAVTWDANSIIASGGKNRLGSSRGKTFTIIR